MDSTHWHRKATPDIPKLRSNTENGGHDFGAAVDFFEPRQASLFIHPANAAHPTLICSRPLRTGRLPWRQPSAKSQVWCKAFLVRAISPQSDDRIAFKS
jgi:hypothetical protein